MDERGRPRVDRLDLGASPNGSRLSLAAHRLLTVCAFPDFGRVANYAVTLPFHQLEQLGSGYPLILHQPWDAEVDESTLLLLMLEGRAIRSRCQR